MATGVERLHGLHQYLFGLEPGGDYWIDAAEKFDLRKISVSDLVAHGIDGTRAEKVVAALRRQDVAELADALGIRLRIKFKAWAEREGSTCRVKVEGAENAEWLRTYISSAVPNARVSEATQQANGRFYRFTVNCNDDSGPWRLQRALIDCPATIAMQIPVVRIVERPHYRLESVELAGWIERQGEDTWWSVDGDPLLTGQVHFPCPPGELSAALRSINKPLLVDDPDDNATGEELIADHVDRAVTVDHLGIRHLYLTWKDGEVDWLLSDDEELVESDA